MCEIAERALEHLWFVTLFFMVVEFHFGSEPLVTAQATTFMSDTAQLTHWQMERKSPCCTSLTLIACKLLATNGAADFKVGEL